MKSKFFTALLFSMLSALSVPSFAQAISNTVDAGNNLNGAWNGQNFLAPATEQITKISIRPEANYSGTLYIYNGNMGSGTSGAIGAPAYTQAGVSLPATVSNGPMQDIVLTTPFPVTAGNSYTFILSGASSFFVTDTDTYVSGEVIVFYASTFIPGYDLIFQIWTAPIPVPPPAPASIPTVSQWGLMLMSAALALFGLVGVRRRLKAR